MTEADTTLDADLHSEFQKAVSAVDEKMMSLIQAYILDGYKDSLCKLLAYLGSDRAEAVLAQIAEPLRTELKERFNALPEKTAVSPAAIFEAGHVMRKNGFAGMNAVQPIVATRHNFDMAALNDELGRIFERNPILSLNLRQNLLLFQDLLLLDDRCIQKVLREVDSQELAKALKGEDSEVQDKIFRNMSRRAATMLREDMEFMGAVRMSDVREAQQHIMEIVLRLEENGEIVIARSEIEVLV